MSAAETTTTRASGGETFASLLEAAFAAQTDSLKEGEIVSGTVIKVGKDKVIVDIGYKSEGVIPVSEFATPSG